MKAWIPRNRQALDKMYQNSALFYFLFYNVPISLKLVEGRERIFLDHFWISFSGNPGAVAISEEDRQAYAAAYAQKGAMKAGLGYFRAFPKDAEENKQFLRAGRLPMSVLVLEGELAMGGDLTVQAK